MSADPDLNPNLAGLLKKLTPKARAAVNLAGGPSPRQIKPAQALGSRDLRGRAVAATIDHTLLKPGSTPAQVERLCAEAVEYGFAAVCVNSGLLPQAVAALAGTPVKSAATVGFPLGATTPQVKAVEADQAVQAGAAEIDMVIDLGHLKAGDHRHVAEDVLFVLRPCHAAGVPVKLIIETSLLSFEEKVLACLLGAEAGVDFVKTSTGFSGGGATVEDISLMRRVVGPAIGVKASGGIRTLHDAEAMIAAGACRLGTGAGVAIMQEALGAWANPKVKAPGY